MKININKQLIQESVDKIIGQANFSNSATKPVYSPGSTAANLSIGNAALEVANQNGTRILNTTDNPNSYLNQKRKELEQQITNPESKTYIKRDIGTSDSIDPSTGTVTNSQGESESIYNTIAANGTPIHIKEEPVVTLTTSDKILSNINAQKLNNPYGNNQL